MLIRDATPNDWPQVWSFLRQIVTARETYAYDPDIDEATARELWLVGPPARTVVAVDGDGTVLGTANMYANRPGPGSHVASASFMVDPRAAGQGIGRALGEEALAWARIVGFHAMQFNAVVETNTPAVALWRSLGFEIIGTCLKRFGTRPTATSDCTSCTAASEGAHCASPHRAGDGSPELSEWTNRAARGPLRRFRIVAAGSGASASASRGRRLEAAAGDRATAA